MSLEFYSNDLFTRKSNKYNIFSSIYPSIFLNNSPFTYASKTPRARSKHNCNPSKII